MKRTESLKAYYQAELLPALKTIEGKRVNVILRIVGTLVGALALMAVLANYVISSVEETAVLYMFIPIFLLLGLAFYLAFETLVKNTPFYKLYKRDVIFKLIKYINPSLHYDKRRFISHKDFNDSKMFPVLPVKFEGDDHVTGAIDDVKIEFSELEVKFKKASDKSRYGNQYQFKGIFFKAYCPKPFPSDVVIEPRGSEVPSGHHLLSIPNADFEAVFQVRIPQADFISQAEEMMTPSLCQNILSFYEKVQNEMHISLRYNQMFVAIQHPGELFEPTLFSSVVDFSKVRSHFFDLYYPISIIEMIAAHKEVDLQAEMEEAEEDKKTEAVV